MAQKNNPVVLTLMSKDTPNKGTNVHTPMLLNKLMWDLMALTLTRLRFLKPTSLGTRQQNQRIKIHGTIWLMREKMKTLGMDTKHPRAIGNIKKNYLIFQMRHHGLDTLLQGVMLNAVQTQLARTESNVAINPHGM